MEVKLLNLHLHLDTGSAIKGKIELIFLLEEGKKAEKIAGMLKKKLLLYVLFLIVNKMTDNEWEEFKKK